MRAVKQKNTTPETVVRRSLHALGLRFRLHRKGLPGTPDVVLPRFKTAIFVHGCFWHRHRDCSRASTPKTRREFWQAKFDSNVERDERKARELSDLGWRVLTIWECETRQPDRLTYRLKTEFGLDPCDENGIVQPPAVRRK